MELGTCLLPDVRQKQVPRDMIVVQSTYMLIDHRFWPFLLSLIDEMAQKEMNAFSRTDTNLLNVQIKLKQNNHSNETKIHPSEYPRCY